MTSPNINMAQNVVTQVIIQQPNYSEPKSKTVAVILAILFGFWSYLYTYSYDLKKFLFSIIMNIIAMPIILYFVIMGSSSAFIFLWIFLGFFYIWPILNLLIRLASIYKNYPNY